MGQLLTILGVIVVLTVVAALAVHHTLQRRNRVVSGVRTTVPVSWLTSGRREARIHRRLRASGRRLDLVPATDDVAEIVTRLRVELVELDAHLVTVARRPSRDRRADRSRLVERVEEIERLVLRVEERTRSDVVSLEELGRRLDLLEAADGELDALEAGEPPEDPIDR